MLLRYVIQHNWLRGRRRLGRVIFGFGFSLGFCFRLCLLDLIRQVSIFRLQFVCNCFDFGLFLDQLFELVLESLCFVLILSELLICGVVIFGNLDCVIQSRGTLAFGVTHLDPITQRLIKLQAFFVQVQHDDCIFTLLRLFIFSNGTSLEATGIWQLQRKRDLVNSEIVVGRDENGDANRLADHEILNRPLNDYLWR